MTKFFVFLLLLVPTSVFSQAFSTSLDVPALTSGPGRRSSTDPAIAFDRQILVQVNGGGIAGEMCLYINTITGDIGVTYGRAGELGGCEINVNERKFRFMLIRSSGQVQSYMTTEKNGELKHYMSTGNSEIFPVTFPRMENTELHRLGITDEGSRRRPIHSRAYRANASAPTFYLHGRTDPATITAQDFLGYSGIGYLKSNRGIFMAVRTQLGATEFRVYSWTDAAARLDPDLFEQVEVIMNEKIGSSLDRQENKLRDETFSGSCVMEEEELRRLKLEDVEARRRLNSERNRGNVYESESARKATSELMMPNLRVMHQELTVKICKAQERHSRTRSETTRADLERRINCHRRSQGELGNLQAEWDSIDRRYPNDAGRASAEKTRTYTRIMTIGADCR